MYKSCLNLLCTFYLIRVYINRQTDKQTKIPKMLEMDSVNYPNFFLNIFNVQKRFFYRFIINIDKYIRKFYFLTFLSQLMSNNCYPYYLILKY